jgi:hypothetical protein
MVLFQPSVDKTASLFNVDLITFTARPSSAEGNCEGCSPEEHRFSHFPVCVCVCVCVCVQGGLAPGKCNDELVTWTLNQASTLKIITVPSETFALYKCGVIQMHPLNLMDH